MVLWSLFGLVAHLLSLAVPAVGMAAKGLRDVIALAGGLVLVHHWREGRAGAFRRGFAHGAHCVGCCWGLMLVLFAVGLMNLVAIIGLTGVIVAEKVVPHGPLIGNVAAGALVLYGVLTIVLPMPR